MERNVRELLGARRVSDRSKSPNRFANAKAVIVAAHHCDFAAVVGRNESSRRTHFAARAENIVVDAMISQVPHLVVVSTAMVTGTRPGRPVILDDDPLEPQREGYVGDVVAFEEAFHTAIIALPQDKAPHVTVVRPTAVVGPDIDTLVTRHFEAPRVLSIRGEHKPWQFAHVKDVASAIEVVIRERIYGSVVVGAVRQDEHGTLIPDQLCMQELLAVTGMRGIEVTKDMAFSTAHRLHRFGVLPAPARDLEMAVYPWSVNPIKLVEHGWRSQVSSEQCAQEIAEQVRGRIGVAGRRVGHRDAAALGAAGAAVALLSTAAIWRQARGRS
jgi:nucleoside-diphosphate-sugar epimerase